MERTTMYRRRGALVALFTALLLLVTSLAVAAPAGATSARPQAAAGSPDCTGFTAGTGRYVATVYQTILGRCPDTLGGNYWVGQIDSHKISTTAFARNIVLSNESLELVVGQLYEQFLDRSASGTEVQYWATQMHNSGLLFPTAAQIVGSAELYNIILEEDSNDRQEADVDFISFVYDQLLDRDVDERSGEFWLSYLGTDETHSSTTTTRTAMALSFFRSDEYSQSAILTTYEYYLGRAPDSGGAQFWLAYLHGGNSYANFIATILGSTEFYNLTQATVPTARTALAGGGAGLPPLAGPQGPAARAKAMAPSS